MSEHLSDDVLTELREQLEARRAKLSNSSKRALDEIRVEQDRGGRDSVDESTDEQGTSKMLALQGREKDFLTKINTALERMAEGSYGLCVDCGGEIPVKRLQARPVTLLCIECKEDRERKSANSKRRPGLMRDYGTGPD